MLLLKHLLKIYPLFSWRNSRSTKQIIIHEPIWLNGFYKEKHYPISWLTLKCFGQCITEVILMWDWRQKCETGRPKFFWLHIIQQYDTYVQLGSIIFLDYWKQFESGFGIKQHKNQKPIWNKRDLLEGRERNPLRAIIDYEKTPAPTFK